MVFGVARLRREPNFGVETAIGKSGMSARAS
jgi:hypothetical protein